MNITDLLTDKKYLQISRNVCRNHNLLHDLHSEAILVILEKKVDINTIRNLEHYFSTVVWMTWHSNKFKKKYLNDFLDFFEYYDYDLIDESIEHSDFTPAYNFIDREPKTDTEYYEINLFKLYLELGSIQAVSRKTKIPYQTVFYDLKQIKEQIINDKTFNQSEPE